MTKRARTTLFSICIFSFLLVTPALIFYFQGYRFDFEEKKITKTGAFYFKMEPANAEVYLNNDFKKKASGFTNSVMIENLIPKKYQVEIKKEGYHSWRKTLEIKERRVTEAKNIILFPQDLNFTIVSEKPETEMAATSSDKKKVVGFNNYEIWVSFPKEEKKVFIARFSEIISRVFWLTDYYLIFNAGDKIKVAEIDDRDSINIVNLAEFTSPEIFWDGKNKSLYVQSEKKIYLLENLLP